MKQLLISLLSLVSIFASAQTSNLRVGSYNLWISTIGKGDYTWELRRERLANSIVDLNMDIFSVQEVDTRIQEELPLLLKERGADYSFWYFSPYSQDGKGTKAHGIAYRTSRFELLETHYFWYSETPKIMSSGWDEMKFKRGGCCAIVLDKENGEKFFFVSTHGPLGKEARAHGAKILNKYAKKYNKKKLPAFMAGDLNAKPEDPATATYKTYWTDSFLVLPEDKKEGPTGTFNGHDINRDMENSARIDYVYYRSKKITPVKYVCDTTKYNGLWASDHCPVYVDFEIKY